MVTPPGIRYLPSVHPDFGVIRGWEPGMGEFKRRVSRMIALRSGRESTCLYVADASIETSSVRRRAW